jgi:hypothetical protein
MTLADRSSSMPGTRRRAFMAWLSLVAMLFATVGVHAIHPFVCRKTCLCSEHQYCDDHCCTGPNDRHASLSADAGHAAGEHHACPVCQILKSFNSGRLAIEAASRVAAPPCDCVCTGRRAIASVFVDPLHFSRAPPVAPVSFCEPPGPFLCASQTGDVLCADRV